MFCIDRGSPGQEIFKIYHSSPRTCCLRLELLMRTGLDVYSLESFPPYLITISLSQDYKSQVRRLHRHRALVVPRRASLSSPQNARDTASLTTLIYPTYTGRLDVRLVSLIVYRPSLNNLSVSLHHSHRAHIFSEYRAEQIDRVFFFPPEAF